MNRPASSTHNPLSPFAPPLSREQEIAQMRAEHTALTAENAVLTGHIVSLNALLEAFKEECKLLRANYDILRLENENLRHTLALLQRTIYGPKSEKTGPDKSPQAAEGETFNEAEAGAGEAEAEGEEEESKEGGTIEGQAVKRKPNRRRVTTQDTSRSRRRGRGE